MHTATLDAFLDTFTGSGDAVKLQVAEVIRSFASASLSVRKAINEGALGSAFASARQTANADGDEQKELDILADNVFLEAARKAEVAWYASEELPNAVSIKPGAAISIAIDPLDGSSNIDTNVSIGSIFSILPSRESAEETFAQTGSKQLAAGFFIYGPQLALVLSKGNGTRIYVFSSRLGTFVQAYQSITIPTTAKEFAVNASNYRHWDEPTRLYIDDCFAGTSGPREKDFNMRWIASLVADTYRIMIRGGVYLYPADTRRGYGSGRLRLVYEANPIAMLVEQAGGVATDGVNRILDIVPSGLHQRTPLVFGARREVEMIARYTLEPSAIGNRHPLFGTRGLFRA